MFNLGIKALIRMKPPVFIRPGWVVVLTDYPAVVLMDDTGEMSKYNPPRY